MAETSYPPQRVTMFVPNEYAPDPRVHVESKALLAAGFDVQVFAFQEGPLNSVPTQSQVDGVDVIRIPVPKSELYRNPTSPLVSIRTIPYVLQAILEADPKRVHVHDLVGAQVGRQLKIQRKIPFVFDSHEADYGSLATLWSGLVPKWIKRLAYQRVQIQGLKHAETTVFNNDWALQLWRGHHSAKVIRYRPDPAQFRPSENPPGMTVTYLGGVTTNKGLNLTLDAWEILSRRGERIPLRFIGPLRQGYDLVKELKARGLHELVTFEGPVPYPEVPSVLAGSSVGLMLIDPSVRSYAHSLPNKLMDYLACGLGVISTPLDSVEALKQDGDPIEIIQEITPEAVADAVSRMAGRDYRRSATAMADRIFPWSEMVQSMAALHASGVAPNRP